MRDMKVRRKEFEAFPGYIDRLNTFVRNATTVLDKIKLNKTWIAAEQFVPVTEKLADLKEWIQNKTAERKEKPATSEPVLTEALVKAKMSAIRVLIRTLNAIEKPKPTPKAENKTEENIEINLESDKDSGKAANSTKPESEEEPADKPKNSTKAEGKPKIEDL